MGSWDEKVMHQRIIIDPTICNGKPVIRGTRMPVAAIVGSLAGRLKPELQHRAKLLEWQ
jgi:uncharacterized protein (DUF433 family)